MRKCLQDLKNAKKYFEEDLEDSIKDQHYSRAYHLDLVINLIKEEILREEEYTHE